MRERRLELAERRRAVLAEIRMLPGHHDFLTPPPVSALIEQSRSGPIVVLNATDLRCDALIVADRKVRVVKLPLLSMRDVHANVAALATAVAEPPAEKNDTDPAADRSEPEATETTISGILGWLWDTTAKPVVAALSPWPYKLKGPKRIWWVPTGLLSFLPIHAASRLEEDRSAMDDVVPSYAASIQSLRHLRAKPETPGSGDSVLVVAVPHHGEPLPAAAREADYVTGRYAPCVQTLVAAEATKERVLAALPHHRRVHFAGHAISDLAQPSSGFLQLHDERLTVLDVSRLNLGAADLAFLSACDTAHSALAFADEPIHITASFQIAGYRRVIGTLWPVVDALAARCARNVYEALDDNPDPAAVATAVHLAVRNLRHRHPSRPSTWAAHIHVGI